MRACVLGAPHVFEVQQAPIPEPGSGQVRVRLEGSGVCASSLPVWEGRDWFSYPIAAGAPGHEGWGVIDARGPDVTTLSVGDRVAAVSGHAFAEYDVTEASAVAPIPATLLLDPIPGEAIGCAMNIFARSGITAGQTIAIVGIGFIGALLCQLAAGAGAHVIAISRRPFALDLARSLHAGVVVPLDDHDRVVETVAAHTAGGLCDCVIECVGLQGPLDLAARLTRERGRLVIAGFHQDGPRQVDMFLWNWRGLDVINAHERDPALYVRGIRAGLAALESRQIDLDPLLTHRLSLGEVSRAFELTHTRPDGFLKAVVLT